MFDSCTEFEFQVLLSFTEHRITLKYNQCESKYNRNEQSSERTSEGRISIHFNAICMSNHLGAIYLAYICLFSGRQSSFEFRAGRRGRKFGVYSSFGVVFRDSWNRSSPHSYPMLLVSFRAWYHVTSAEYSLDLEPSEPCRRGENFGVLESRGAIS